jgi:hypothetical protein
LRRRAANRFHSFGANLAQPAPEPLVELVEDRGRLGQREVRRPSGKKPVEQLEPHGHGDRAAAGGEFA